ncbi:hemolysin family protein [Chelatococcus sp. SYSU_G07232]|uniref:Hemolysin family protein n=1 Tax=Chelatococcus albus TaxID=3047466 RepID=A0ABT7AIT3_9HYPH|nr:hemolysin family protein [Chelatococcus sp. SYSU_G07232]MDJ1159291.1 hemolysin family protein [Chelatococcus sp. SYSU_G07232]
MLTVELLVVAVLILVNGLLAMSELAVVSARTARLKALADQGRRGAATALALAADPGRFLSTVQIGITLVGILAGAFSGAPLAGRLAAWLATAGLAANVAELLAFGAVVTLITYLSLVVGELVPKQLALRNAEGIAAAVAPAMAVLARLCAPLVWVLSASQHGLLRLLGRSGDGAAAVTEEELRTLVAEAESAGVLEPEERRMIAGVMRLADRSVRAVMTPRREVDWIDLGDDDETIRKTILESGHSRLPAVDGREENVVGIVQAKDVLDAYLAGTTPNIRDVVREAPVVIDTLDALDVLERLKASPVPMALVHDEYGNFEGIVTPADLLVSIAGAFAAGVGPGEPHVVMRQDGSYLLSGAMPADEMAELLQLKLPHERDYHTLAGFVLAVLKSLPQVGEAFEEQGWRFEVIDLDGPRIDKVLAARVGPA